MQYMPQDIGAIFLSPRARTQTIILPAWQNYSKSFSGKPKHLNGKETIESPDDLDSNNTANGDSCIVRSLRRKQTADQMTHVSLIVDIVRCHEWLCQTGVDPRTIKKVSEEVLACYFNFV
jgi:hypothetical protein